VKRKARKVSLAELPPIRLAGRTNYKMFDGGEEGTEHLAFGLVVVDPASECVPGHSHGEQEEIYFCLRGTGVVEVDAGEEIVLNEREAVYIPRQGYHCLKNPGDEILEVLWIISPPGWIGDHDAHFRDRAGG